MTPLDIRKMVEEIKAILERYKNNAEEAGYELPDCFCSDMLALCDKVVLYDRRRVRNEAIEECARTAYSSLEHHSSDKDGNQFWMHCVDVAKELKALRKLEGMER